MLLFKAFELRDFTALHIFSHTAIPPQCLQTLSSLDNYFIHSLILLLQFFKTSLLPNHQRRQGHDILRHCSPPLVCHILHVPCHILHVPCHILHVPCHLLHVKRLWSLTAFQTIVSSLKKSIMYMLHSQIQSLLNSNNDEDLSTWIGEQPCMHANGLLIIFQECFYMYYSWKVVRKPFACMFILQSMWIGT